MSELKGIELPVYKVSYELFLYSFNLIKEVPREYKYTLGEKLKSELTSLLMNVYRANKIRSKEQKLKKVEEAIENIEVIRLLFRLLYDLHVINTENLVKVSVKIENVRRQLFGWEKVLKK